MSAFIYVCHACNEQFEADEKITDDENVCPACETDMALEQLPQIAHIQYLSNTSNENRPTGQVVKEHIEENKDILEDAKRKLKNRMWGDE